ncbi:zinc finger MYND domain-containing protein 10-like [Ostrea edulis]|uniref:zinc finger MYND domain-containing protein 10-like n=1 Tax=Ostrea edulis TaxID=37623 RepID=UPI0024AFE3C9|nr:zinc finger MYND domain-containing protein 10-like [Ostrea edulis]
MNSDGSHVLLSVEAEAYVEHLVKFGIKDIGGRSWSRQHENMEKLNMQAVLNATAQEDEFIKDFLISCGKVEVLVHDLILTEVWKEKVFSELVNMDFEPKTTFPLYMVLYHEATAVNLLETTMFYRETCESAEDSMADLVDYCYRRLTQLVTSSENADEDEEMNDPKLSPETHSGNLEELQKQEKKLNFEICMKSVSLLRYITDNLDSLPLSVMTRMLNTLDIPILLVQLLETPPWTRRKDAKIYKFIDSKWQELDYQESFKITKIEGQIWLALYTLLMNGKCQQKYDLNTNRKNSILKLRSYLTEVMLDQLPILVEMQRYLEQLSMMDIPAPSRELILEQVPEVRENILMENKGKWKKIAKKQSQTYFNPSDSDVKAQAKRWADTYNFDVLEGLLTEPPKCAVCGAEATKRCSRCQNEWYCRRECQVSHWKKHKTACDLIVETTESVKAKG